MINALQMRQAVQARAACGGNGGKGEEGKTQAKRVDVVVMASLSGGHEVEVVASQGASKKWTNRSAAEGWAGGQAK